MSHGKTGNDEAGRFQPTKYGADAMLPDGIGLNQQQSLVQVRGY
jgi:hypothetical protein